MIQSMTGFGRGDADIPGFGKISVELRSTNHKFLESVFHLPVGLLSFEDRIKKTIEARVKRGRITCVISILGGRASGILINKQLLKNYLGVLKCIKKQCRVKGEISVDALINLPGILSLEEAKIQKSGVWRGLNAVVSSALGNLVKMRQKEGRALFGFLKSKAELLEKNLGFIKTRFKKAIKQKLNKLGTDEERSSYLKDTDITEEVERLGFHIKNFKSKLTKGGPIGKELDFIAQEMQREANTLAAKTFDVLISSRIVQTKSQIEKIREQVLNIE